MVRTLVSAAIENGVQLLDQSCYQYVTPRDCGCGLPGEVIKPDTFKCIKDEGMPMHGRPFQKGNLYIHFRVGAPVSCMAAPACSMCDNSGAQDGGSLPDWVCSREVGKSSRWSSVMHAVLHHMQVEFPDRLEASQVAALSTALPSGSSENGSMDVDDHEEVRGRQEEGGSSVL
jgi:DnaJ-class molecular chaperone